MNKQDKEIQKILVAYKYAQSIQAKQATQMLKELLLPKTEVPTLWSHC